MALGGGARRSNASNTHAQPLSHHHFLHSTSEHTPTHNIHTHKVALGLESIATPLDRLPAPVSGAGGAGSGRQKEALAAADEAFASSDLLRELKDRTAANAAKNKKAIADKYCYRQAELGIGDCGGLR